MPFSRRDAEEMRVKLLRAEVEFSYFRIEGKVD